jgi:anti-anti-sigma factor
MGVQFNIDNSGKELTIKVDGRFDFSAHQEFRDAYEAISSDVNSYVVDLGNTSYLDSSALGMLLLLRDHAGGDSASIKIVKCISNFEQLFTIQ